MPETFPFFGYHPNPIETESLKAGIQPFINLSAGIAAKSNFTRIVVKNALPSYRNLRNGDGFARWDAAGSRA